MKISESNLKICSRCIYDERVSQISFDDNGVCNYCKQIDNLKELYGTGTIKGENLFCDIVKDIKQRKNKSKYDIIVGVSGGTDSSYMLYLAKKYGLNPLAVHYDNTWNTSIASQNILKITKALDVDLYTYVINNKEADDIFKSFLKAGVPELEASTDLAIAEVLYRAAKKFNVKYIFEGHSFIEEGITPLGKNYFDGKYIKSIHKKYGRMKMKTYPLMTFSRFIYWTLFRRIRKVRPFWYINYNKNEAQKFLRENYGWEYYGGHHLENRMTAFFHSYYFPRKFKNDYRNNTLSAQVRNKTKLRQIAWEEYNSKPYIEENLIDYFMKRMNYNDEDLKNIINGEKKYWHQFKTYKKRFEFLRPLFYILAKSNLVPMSFYLKYCFPINEK